MSSLLRPAVLRRAEGECTRCASIAIVRRPSLARSCELLSRRAQSLGVQGAIISGGSSLGPHLDDFFEALGLPVINGWGLTETSPVLACRRLDATGAVGRNVRGTSGPVIPGSEIRCAFLPDGAFTLLQPGSYVPLHTGRSYFKLHMGPAFRYSLHSRGPLSFKLHGTWARHVSLRVPCILHMQHVLLCSACALVS